MHRAHHITSSTDSARTLQHVLHAAQPFSTLSTLSTPSSLSTQHKVSQQCAAHRQLPIDAIKLAPAGGGAPVTLTKDAADLCVFLRHAVEDTTDGAPIPVPFDRTTCELVARLLEAFVKRHDELDTKPTFRAALPDTLANSHCGSLAAGDALQLANAANFFGSDALAGVAGSRLAQLVVQCSSADEVCVRFKIECDMSPEERTAVLTELPWTPSSSTVVQQGPVGQFGDAVDCVFKCLEESPPVLLWLKGVSSGWCNHIRERICSLGWAVRQGLQTDWVEGARALSGNPRVLQGFDILLTVTMLNLARCGITTLEAKGVAAMVVFSKSLTTSISNATRSVRRAQKPWAEPYPSASPSRASISSGNNLGAEGAKAIGRGHIRQQVPDGVRSSRQPARRGGLVRCLRCTA